MDKENIFKNTSIYTIVLILPQITSFLLLPLYTRYLIPSDYAIMTLVNSFTAIAVIFISMQMQSGLARYVLKYVTNNENEKAREAFTSIILSMILIIFIFYTLIELYGDKLIKIVYPKTILNYSPYFRLSMLTVICTCIYQAPQALFKSLRLAKNYFYLSIIILFTTIVFNVYFITIKKLGVYGIFLGTFIASIFGLIISIWMVRSWFVKKLSWEYIKLALFYSVPLIPHSLGIYLFTTSNRIILEKYVSLHEIGIFSIADRIATVPLFIVNAFNMAYNPQFIAMAEINKEKAINNTYNIFEYWWAAILLILLGFGLFINIILKIMTTKSYYAASDITVILSLSCIFRGLYSFAVNPLFYSNQTYLIPLITLTSGIFSIILNIMIIPKWGIIGAAWVTVVSYIITFIIVHYIGNKLIRLKYPVKKMIISGIITLFIFIIIRFLKNINNNVIYSFIISIIGIFIYLLYIFKFYKPNIFNLLIKKLNILSTKCENSKRIFNEQGLIENVRDKSI